MRVNWIRAEIECAGCGKPFQVSIDTATKLESYGDLMDVAENAVRGGCSISGGFVESCSIQHDMALCPTCTSKTDRIGDDENYQPTKAEILSATAS